VPILVNWLERGTRRGPWGRRKGEGGKAEVGSAKKNKDDLGRWQSGHEADGKELREAAGGRNSQNSQNSLGAPVGRKRKGGGKREAGGRRQRHIMICNAG
jgi:hypothetical protein